MNAVVGLHDRGYKLSFRAGRQYCEHGRRYNSALHGPTMLGRRTARGIHTTQDTIPARPLRSGAAIWGYSPTVTGRRVQCRYELYGGAVHLKIEELKSRRVQVYVLSHGYDCVSSQEAGPFL